MLTGAGEKKLGQVLENVDLHTPQIPYVANVTAQYVTDAASRKAASDQTGFFFCQMGAECAHHAG